MIIFYYLAPFFGHLIVLHFLSEYKLHIGKAFFLPKHVSSMPSPVVAN